MYWDIKPRPVTEFDKWEQWMNAWAARMISRSSRSKKLVIKTINVKEK
jgi:hypothetical protein